MPFKDDNFENFVDNWDHFKGRIVVFLGAGASMGALNTSQLELPNAYSLRNELWRAFKNGGRNFDPADLGLMSLEHASGIIETSSGRKALNDHLLRTFSCDAPLWHHVALPYLKPSSIFTTNYDELVELGYKCHSDVPDVICEDRSPVPGRVALFKPHGSLGNSLQPIGKGGLVITQFDYFEMISEYRRMLSRSTTSFGESCVVIAGYSFGDMDIGAELFSIRKRNNGTPWYAIFPRRDAQVRDMYANRLNIRQIACTLADFLKELDKRVNFIDPKHKHGRIGPMRKAGLIQ
jgi:hypothetical protein